MPMALLSSRKYKNATGKTWLTGSIYASLSRLLNRDMVESFEGEPTAERGGRRKIYSRLTHEGQMALLAVKQVNSSIWPELPGFEVEDE